MSANEMTVETLLRAHAPVAPDSLRERVLALEPVRRSPARRLALVAIGAAGIATVGVALVHGFVSSGSQSLRQPPVRVTPPPLSTTLAPKRAAGTFDQAGTGSAKAQVVTGSAGRLQHTDASLELQVADDKELANATTRAT